MPTPLEALRQRLHLTVEDLAVRLNVSKTQVQKWERRWEDIPLTRCEKWRSAMASASAPSSAKRRR
ncbi:helix-turn-helix domain-containing protein [Sphingobium scionense]